MTDQTDIVLLQRDIKELRKQNEKQREDIERLKELDTRRMRSAVIILGGLVLSMGAYIWAKIVEG